MCMENFCMLHGNFCKNCIMSAAFYMLHGKMLYKFPASQIFMPIKFYKHHEETCKNCQANM